MRSSHQTITIDGKKAVVLPLAEYQALRERAEMLDDIEQFDVVMARLSREQETFPKDVADRLAAGESPVRVFREHRGLTQRHLAEAAAVSTAAISQIENGRSSSIETLAAIAERLGVALDDLV